MHECFAWPECCGNIFNNKNILNLTFLFQLIVIYLEEFHFDVKN